MLCKGALGAFASCTRIGSIFLPPYSRSTCACWSLSAQPKTGLMRLLKAAPGHLRPTIPDPQRRYCRSGARVSCRRLVVGHGWRIAICKRVCCSTVGGWRGRSARTHTYCSPLQDTRQEIKGTSLEPRSRAFACLGTGNAIVSIRAQFEVRPSAELYLLRSGNVRTGVR